MEKHESILKQVEQKLAPKLLKQHQLICKQVPFGDCAPLYLAKPTWTNRFDKNRQSTIGVFCAVWVSQPLLEKNNFAYNIHSKQIRKLPGYYLTSKEFADGFRDAVKSRVAHWPAISLKHGPTTLLQGKQSSELDNFSENVQARIADFVSISDEIDTLLEASKV